MLRCVNDGEGVAVRMGMDVKLLRERALIILYINGDLSDEVFNRKMSQIKNVSSRPQASQGSPSQTPKSHCLRLVSNPEETEPRSPL